MQGRQLKAMTLTWDLPRHTADRGTIEKARPQPVTATLLRAKGRAAYQQIAQQMERSDFQRLACWAVEEPVQKTNCANGPAKSRAFKRVIERGFVCQPEAGLLVLLTAAPLFAGGVLRSNTRRQEEPNAGRLSRPTIHTPKLAEPSTEGPCPGCFRDGLSGPPPLRPFRQPGAQPPVIPSCVAGGLRAC